MRPGLLSELRLAGARRVEPAAGLGWMVTEPAAGTVSLLDHDAQLVRRVALPSASPHVRVSASGQYIGVADDQQLVVLDIAGDIRWRHARHQTADTELPLHVDARGILWIRPTGELLAVDAATGDEIHRVPLAGPDAAWFLHCPTDTATGLGLLEPYSAPSFVVRMENGRIALRQLGAPGLAGFSPDGSRYLILDADEGFLSVRDLATESVLAECHPDDLTDLPSRFRFGDWTFEYPALFLTDEIIMVALGARDNAADDIHLLLSARSLRVRSQVDYPDPRWSGSIVSAEQAGRWLTRGYPDNTLRLWQIGDQSPPSASSALDDEPMAGQTALF